MAAHAVHNRWVHSQHDSAEAGQGGFWVRMAGFCFVRFREEAHQAWLADAPAWIEALPFRAFYIFVWNFLASNQKWAKRLTIILTLVSLLTMALQVFAMVMVSRNPHSTAGYWRAFYIGSFGALAFETAWLMTQIIFGLAAQHVKSLTCSAPDCSTAAPGAAAQPRPAAGGESRVVRSPLRFPQATAQNPPEHLRSVREEGSISSVGSAPASSCGRQGSSFFPSVADNAQLNGRLLGNKHAITTVFSVLLWLAWAVHISGLYVYSHACAVFRHEATARGFVIRVAAFNCLELKRAGDFGRDPMERHALVGQLLHALVSCSMLLVFWAMPPKAPFAPHGLLKWGVLIYAVFTFTQLSLAVLQSGESTSNKTSSEALTMFIIRVLSCVFAVLAVVPLPPLSYLLSQGSSATEPSESVLADLALKRQTQDLVRDGKKEAAVVRLQENQLNTCMQCSRWSMAVGLFTYVLLFTVLALLPLTGGTFVWSWGYLGFLPGTGLSVYEVLLPLAVASPLLLIIARSMFMTLLSIHELCHRVHMSSAVYGWLTKYCLRCCCEVLCFACCCCYACCREEQERVIRGNFSCPNCRDAWANNPALQCSNCLLPKQRCRHEEATPILHTGGPFPRSSNSASPGYGTESKATFRNTKSPVCDVGTNQVHPSVDAGAGGAAAGSSTKATATQSGSNTGNTNDTASQRQVLRLLRHLSDSDLLAGVTARPTRGHLVRKNIQGIADLAREAATGTAASSSQRESAMQEAANDLSDLLVVDLLDTDQYHCLLKALLPDSCNVVVYKGPPQISEREATRGHPSYRRRSSVSPDVNRQDELLSIDAADPPQIAWMPYSVWGFAVGSVLIPPLLRVAQGDRFFYYSRQSLSDEAHIFAKTRLTLSLTLLTAFGLLGAYSLRKTLRLLHRIRITVQCAVQLDLHAEEWKFPHDRKGANEWSARLLFASRFVSAHFTGATAGFLSAWLLGTLLSALTLAILVLAGVDWPHALNTPEFYALGSVLLAYVAVGLFMLLQLLQTDDLILTSIRNVSVLSARGGVINTYRNLMMRCTSSTNMLHTTDGAERSPHLAGNDFAEHTEHDLQLASYTQLQAATWQQRYPGIQILLIEGLEMSRVTLSKASFQALVASAAVSCFSALGRLLYEHLTKLS